MNNLRIIDADGHVQERDADWQELLEQPYRKHAPKMVTGPRRQGTTASRRKDLGEALRHWPRHRHCALQPQAAENHGDV